MCNIARSVSTRLGSLLIAGFYAALGGLAIPCAQAADTIAQVPLYLAQTVPPIMMLDMSRDHQLYFKAFDDYSALIDPDTPNTTYTDGFDYYGYFDPHLCYQYSEDSSRFEPIASTVSTDSHYCQPGNQQWSGNFLNWASMTRIDEMRKILYGGYRSTDTSSDTTLERSYLPNDAHSFAKYYAGSDIQQLTPFDPLIPASEATYRSSTTQSIPTNTANLGSFTFTIDAFSDARKTPEVGDQVIVANTTSPTNLMRGVVTSYDGSSRQLKVYMTSFQGSGNNISDWSITNPTRIGITLCNTTVDTHLSDARVYSENVTDPPLIRVAQGDYALWAANERWQCRWQEEKKDTGQMKFPPGSAVYPSNGNDISRTGLEANNTNPVRQDVQLKAGSAGPDYIARIQVCKTDLIGDSEKCKQYPQSGSTKKPIGVLQEYGDDGSIWVGLLTGSYGKSKSGGVLRKTATPFNNLAALKSGNTDTSEVNATSDGTFTGTSGIVTAVDALRIYGYSHSNNNDTGGTYRVGTEDNCDWGKNSFKNGRCTNWGNPQAEIFLESLRYLAGSPDGRPGSPDPSFSSDDSGRLAGLVTASWNAPLSNDNWCASLNVLNFNASVTSYDGDELGGVSDLNTSDSASDLTKTVGDGEGISGNSYFVGENGTDNNQLCTAKTVGSLGSAKGACPEAPRLEGTWNIAGLAYDAHTNSIRTDLKNSQNEATTQLVTTYGVALAPAIPQVTVPVPGHPGQTVKILPACRDYDNNTGALIGNCAVVDFKIVQPYTEEGDVGTGSLYVNWEDSEQGGDFDQDMSGVLTYTITSSQITVTTQTYILSTPYRMAFGYVISGTTEDGFHAHSGINGFTYPGGDPTGVTACTGCNVTDSATSVTYELGSSAGGILQPALWYAAKWGGFNDVNKNGTPDEGEWDAVTSGQPDNYSAVTDPSKLEAALEKVFKKVSSEISSSSSVVANSVALQTDARLYQARFNSGDWSGQLWSYVLNSDGSVGNVEWDADCVLSEISPCQIRDTTHGSVYNLASVNDQPSRRVITYKPYRDNEDPAGPTGVPFTWTGLGTSSATPALTAQQTLLDTIPYGAATDTDTNGEARLDYLRGDHSDEQQNSGIFRNRTSILGDIVDSSPAYVGPPGFSYPDTWADGGPETGYSKFRTDQADRTPVVYAGANDGMLHGFDASVDHSVNPPVGGITSTSGTEVLAYVPNAVFANLSKLTSPNYVHQYYVDGPPTAGDVYFGDAWHTVLVGGLRGGGAGIYALDITKPANFSEDNAAKIVLWEFSNVDTSNGTTGPGHDQNLGYTFSQPAIVRLANKKWAAVFGNGYHNKDLLGNGMAYLYVVDIQTGKLIKTFGPLGDSTSNGLSTPAPVDVDGDNVVDYIYAGDLQGNLWKFQFKDPDDPSSDPSNPSNWNVAFSGSPLYTATDDTTAHNRQPITTRPEVGASPTGQGLLIYFGTGKYFESGDNNVTGATAQTFYAIWDKNDGTHGFDRSKLQEQTVLTSTTTDGYNLRVTSDNSIAWNTGSNDTTGKLGWYIDLPTTGERQVSDSVLRGGQIIFTTLIPSQAPCDFGGSSWLMELDASSGSRPATSPFDISGDGRFDSEDLVEVTLPGHDEKQQVPSSGIAPTDPGIFWTPLIVSETTGIRQHKYMSESTSAVWHITENPGSAGRQTWRQIR